MKQVKILLLDPSVESSVKTQAALKGFKFVNTSQNIMVFEKDDGNIQNISDLKYLPDLAPFIKILL